MLLVKGKGGELMRIVFCDDNPAVLKQIHALVEEFFRGIGHLMPEFACYESGEAMLAQERRVDMAFLDIEMPGIDGLQAGAKLRERNPFVTIFIVTGYPEHLDAAMRLRVFRYLSKPIDKERLFNNLDEAMAQYFLYSREYPIVTADGIAVRRAEEIICVEAVQRKVLIHTLDQILISTETMEHWRNALTLPCFYSPHRSFIINMRFVNTISKDKILLKYGDRHKEAYLARRRFNEFKETFLLYLERVR